MTDHGRRCLSRRDAEQLLSNPSSSRHALAPLLDAARSSQTRIDQAREDAATAAFVAAVSAPVAEAPAARRTRRPVTRALAATGLAVSLTTGGVALAASGELSDVPILRDLPGLPDQASDRASESVGKASPGAGASATPSTGAETTGPGTTGPESAEPGTNEPGTSEPGGTATAKPDKPSGSTTPSPKPDLRGLCHAFQSPGSGGSSAGSAPFAVLAEAAGGRDEVEEFCVALVGEPKPQKPRPSAEPEHPEPVHPSPSASTTKPEDAGQPDDTGKPESSGRPEGAAKTDGAGKPEGAGQDHAHGHAKGHARR